MAGAGCERVGGERGVERGFAKSRVFAGAGLAACVPGDKPTAQIEVVGFGDDREISAANELALEDHRVPVAPVDLDLAVLSVVAGEHTVFIAEEVAEEFETCVRSDAINVAATAVVMDGPQTPQQLLPVALLTCLAQLDDDRPRM
jgi:hypothetical protein